MIKINLNFREEEGGDVGLILGISLGAIIFIGAIIYAVYKCKKSKKGKEEDQKNDSSLSSGLINDVWTYNRSLVYF